MPADATPAAGSSGLTGAELVACGRLAAGRPAGERKAAKTSYHRRTRSHDEAAPRRTRNAYLGGRAAEGRSPPTHGRSSGPGRAEPWLYRAAEHAIRAALSAIESALLCIDDELPDVADLIGSRIVLWYAIWCGEVATLIVKDTGTTALEFDEIFDVEMIERGAGRPLTVEDVIGRE
jgi:hypothetical protein